MRRITLRDIARELDMNESTVSYALAGKGSIGEKTRQLVRETAERMGYVPNQAARQISMGKSAMIAIVVPNVLAEYGEFCEYAFRFFREKGWQTQILISEFSPEREMAIAESLIGQNAAGALLIPAIPPGETGDSPALRRLREAGIAVIARNAGTEIPSVSLDFEAIGRGFGERFLRSARTRIRIAVPHPAPFAENVNGVMRGLQSVLGKNADVRIEAPAVPLPEELAEGTNAHYEYQIRNMLSRGGIEAGRALCRRMSESADAPDAVICPHEACALGILLEAERLGLRIPEDLELAACQRGCYADAAPRRIAAGYVSQKRIALAMSGHLLELLKTGGTQNETLAPEFDNAETLKIS